MSLFRKKNKDPLGDLSILSCDMHSHLIPGIDDGAPDLETSLELIRGMLELGYKKIVTTPHIHPDHYPNTPDIILPGHRTVSDEIARQQLPVEFRAAAEYFMDNRLEELLDAGAPLLTLKDNMILVEISFAAPAIDLMGLLFKLQIKGYQPVLAHPERYLYFGANKAWYDQLKSSGCLFQVNLLSLIGYYGKESRELALYLSKKEYIDLLGTDLHHKRHLGALQTSPELYGIVHKLVDSGKIRNADL